MKVLDLFLDWATDQRLAVLDTETTGLRGEVIEVSIIDVNGNTLFDERVKPSGPIESGAQVIHGISDADVADKPSIAHFWPQLREIFGERRVVIYNADFDRQCLSNSLDAAMPGWWLHPSGIGHSDEYQPFLDFWQNCECVMEAYAPIHGDWHDYYGNYRWAKLSDACRERGVDTGDLKAHAALDDCRATLRLIQAVARLTPKDVPWLGEQNA